MEKERMELELYEAAKSGNFNCLTNMVGYPQINFNQTTLMGNNLLHIAAQYRREGFIKHLLDQCPSSGKSLLFQGNHKGDTPLHVTVKVGSLSISKIFIDFAKTLVSDVEGGQVDLRKELLRRENVDKDTATHYAARYGHSLVATLLIGLDPEQCNVANVAAESPLYLAIAQRKSDTAEGILLASPPQSAHNGPRGMTALHAVLDYESIPFNLMKIMVERRPQMIRERDDIGWTPLHYAACYDKIEAVQLFLKHDVSAAYLLDNAGESALHIAAFSGHIDVIKELIKSSPDACDLINNKGQTALHIAVIGGRLDVVKFILGMPNFELLINEQDKEGNTALHLAALHRQYDIIYFFARNQRASHRLLNKEHLSALTIFDRHGEVGFRAVKIDCLLEGTSGVQFMQDSAKKGVTGLENKSVERQSATSTATTNNNENNKGKIDPSSQREVSIIVTVLIATVTFAAAFTVPGGFKNDEPNQGMATLAGMAAFKAFVVFNTVAFAFSILALFLQFDTSFFADGLRGRYDGVARLFIFVALQGMMLSFACGNHILLGPKNQGLEVFLSLLGACLFIMYVIGCLLQPGIYPAVLGAGTGRCVRKFVFGRGIL